MLFSQKIGKNHSSAGGFPLFFWKHFVQKTEQEIENR